MSVGKWSIKCWSLRKDFRNPLPPTGWWLTGWGSARTGLTPSLCRSSTGCHPPCWRLALHSSGIGDTAFSKEWTRQFKKSKTTCRQWLLESRPGYRHCLENNYSPQLKSWTKGQKHYTNSSWKWGEGGSQFLGSNTNLLQNLGRARASAFLSETESSACWETNDSVSTRIKQHESCSCTNIKQTFSQKF